MMTRRQFVPSVLLASSAASGAPQKPAGRSEFDYIDWSWEAWRNITHENRTQQATEQSGKAELITLVPKTRDAWPERRESFAQVLNVFLGTQPGAKPALAPKVIEERSEDAYTRRKLLYQSEAGERVPAYLLVPNKLRGRAPVVLCPHQTTQAGKDSPAGLADDPHLHMAVHLVRRGYVSFTWDALCFGERHNPGSGHYGDSIPFYRKHPEWSLMSKMVWDLSRGIDYLETLDFVDPTRVGCIGHSHGAITTLFAMAFDSRIVAGVSNCGFDTFRIDGNVWRWSRATALLPRLGFYISSPYLTNSFYRAVPDSEVITTPFDMHQLLALIAPRALMLATSDEDFVFPNGGWSARLSLARLQPLYDLLGAGDRLASYYFNAGHSFPEGASSRAYAWLDRWLKP